jgi:hypothetical protein
MRKHVVFFLISLFFIFSSTCLAVDLKGKFAVGGNGGLIIPVGDFADKEKGAAKSGFQFYGTAEYYATDNLSFGGFIGYYSLGTDNEAMKSVLMEQNQIPADELDVTQKGMGFGAFGKYTFQVHEKAAPYVKLGGGMGKPKFSGTIKISALSLDGDFEGDYDMQPLVFGGGGLLYQIAPNVGLGVEALFLQVFSDGGEGEITLGGQTQDDEIFFDMQALQLSACVFYFFGPR